MENKPQLFTDAESQLALNSPYTFAFSVDRNYRYACFNRLHAETMQLVWGVSPAVGIDILTEVIQDEQDRRKLKANFDSVFAGDSLRLIEAFGHASRDPDSRRLYDCHYVPARSESGETIGAMVFGTDVTERHQLAADRLALENKLQEASQLESMGLLVSSVAHDFNNFLVPILLSAELAMSTLEKSHPAVEMLTTVMESARNAADLTKQLLGSSHSNDNTRDLIELNNLISNSAEVARVAMRRRAELTISLSYQSLNLFGSATQLRQVIMNLLINAADAATGVFPKVIVETSSLHVTGFVSGLVSGKVTFPPEVPVGDYAIITVSDNGCGMTEEQLSRIFDPFYSTKGSGRGFGLTAIKGIVRNHNGFLTVDSMPGKGSTFRIGIPLAETIPAEFLTEADATDFESAQSQEPRMKILVADDNPGVMLCVASLCSRLGHDVITAADGIETILAFNRHRFDLILLDAEMRDVSCEEILDTLPKLIATPVALMSSQGRDATLLSNPRVHTILAKPFSVENVLTIIKRFKPLHNGSFSTSER